MIGAPLANSTVLLSVLAASLVGSLHCAGMCGGFVAFYASDADRLTLWQRLEAHGGYHLGRLTTYTLLGAAAGSVGAAADLAGESAGVGRVAALTAAVVMIAWGGLRLAEATGFAPHGPRLPKALAALSVRVIGALRGFSPRSRGTLLGLASTLLPCGWLYAFAVSAAGTGSPLAGAAVMAAFWAGTVPLLLGFGALVEVVARPLRQRLPVVSALSILVVGLAFVLTRSHVPSLAGAATSLDPAAPKPCCHRAAH